MCSTCIKEYYSAWKRDVIQTPAPPWIEVQYTIFSDMSQAQKETAGRVPLPGVPGINQSHRDRNGVVGAGGWGEDEVSAWSFRAQR